MKIDLELSNSFNNCIKDKGITLIALVITIIVLLLLAGVSIQMLTGSNGIFYQAEDARETTDFESDGELRDITSNVASGNFSMTWYEYQDGDETKKVPVPANFAVSEVPGEGVVDNGLVIIDETGNEFVWIPCNLEDYRKAKGYVRDKGWNENQYLKHAWVNTDSNGNFFTGDNEIYSAGQEGDPNKITETNKAMKSIEKYGGFYVARFEAGVPSDASFYVPADKNGDGAAYIIENDEGENVRNVSDLKPVSQRWKQVWNCIDQDKAKQVSEAMYSDNETVNSYLIDSHAWNYICEHIYKEKLGVNLLNSSNYGNFFNNKTTAYDSIRWSLFSIHTLVIPEKGEKYWVPDTKYQYGKKQKDVQRGGKLTAFELSTGASEDFKLYNIYDMAGNVWEWIAEVGCKYDDHKDGDNKYAVSTADEVLAVVRGGVALDAGNDSPIVYSDGTCRTRNYNRVSYGFRVVLYLE